MVLFFVTFPNPIISFFLDDACIFAKIHVIIATICVFSPKFIIFFYFSSFAVYRLVSVGTIEEITYARQVYKQQMGEIGLHGKNERRYFMGVAGVKGEEGELFGMANLFKLNINNTSHVMTNGK